MHLENFMPQKDKSVIFEVHKMLFILLLYEFKLPFTENLDILSHRGKFMRKVVVRESLT